MTKKRKSLLPPEDLVKRGKRGKRRDPVILSIRPLYDDPMGARITEWARKAYEELAERTQFSQIKLFSVRGEQSDSRRMEIFLDTLFFELLSPPPEGEGGSSSRPHRASANINHKIHTFLESKEMFDQELKLYLTDLAKKALGELKLESPRPFYWSVLRVDPRAVEQNLHKDQANDSEYWSILIPLTNHPNQGHTEFPDSTGITAFPNSTYAFDGNTWHYGTANHSDHVRYALMGVTHAPGCEDANRVIANPCCAVPM
jgi:hypothetical protein